MRVEITVDGIKVPYNIPDELIETIYRERRREYYREDLLHRIAQYIDDQFIDYGDESNIIINCADDAEIDIGYTTLTGAELKAKVNDPKWMDSLVSEFMDQIDGCDPYWEYYWSLAENAIQTCIEEGK